MNFLIILTLSFALVLLCFIGISVKLLLRKKGEFKRRCASIDPYSGKHSGCVCAERHNASCRQRELHPYQPLDVNDNLMKEINIK